MTLKYYCAKRKEWLEPETSVRLNKKHTLEKYSQAENCKYFIHSKEYKIRKRAKARILLVKCVYCRLTWNLKDSTTCPRCGATEYKEIT